MTLGGKIINKEKNKTGSIVLIVGLCLVISGLMAYIIFRSDNSNYTYDNVTGYYEIVDDDDPSFVVYQLVLFDDGSFKIEETPNGIILGNYLIEKDKITLNYQLGLGGGYPPSIQSLSETKELTIKTLNTLISVDGEYVRNDDLKDAKLVKINFDGEKDYIISIDETK